MIKAEFSASLLQSSVSHDPTEIILICRFAAQETFLIIILIENIKKTIFNNSFIVGVGCTFVNNLISKIIDMSLIAGSLLRILSSAVLHSEFSNL